MQRPCAAKAHIHTGDLIARRANAQKARSATNAFLLWFDDRKLMSRQAVLVDQA